MFYLYSQSNATEEKLFPSMVSAANGDQPKSVLWSWMVSRFEPIFIMSFLPLTASPQPSINFLVWFLFLRIRFHPWERDMAVFWLCLQPRKHLLNWFCTQSMMWATTSSSSYAGTCIFLVILGVILLFFVSSRSMLEKRWSRRELNRRHVLFLNKESSGLMDKSETLLTRNGPEKDIIIIEQPTRARRSWKTIMLKATMTTLILAILYVQ